MPPGADRISDSALAGWALVNFLMLPVLRMFWFMPGHDGLRQLVPALFFVPILVASAVHVLLGECRGGSVRRPATTATDATGGRRRGARWWGGLVLIVACIGSAAWGTLRIHPYELAYYNALIGGPAGAKAAGMETTYYWDAAGEPVPEWINEHLPAEATVLIFPPPDVRTFDWLQRWGKLRSDLRFLNLDPPVFNQRLRLMLGDDPCYVLFLMRQGLYMPRPGGPGDLFAELAESDALYELKPERVGVRLLAIFDKQRFRSLLQTEVADAAIESHQR